ncbi:DUF934 domain-containing protein [Shinella zoogloeoides]|uniref:DUF934 domain-containing protein n=1 Tax=Shinella zoogloeoides TaxID=352475 RepID=A0A6N8T8D5_SHIZO|nr:DUF934 domain-containing protein [Shinella zoogloeoides]MXN98704.1 DUF934 domain-containing protein [Shinella zoogloeoides]UEX83157.1 DUF934 domain-containing protein [Shinella zoogloeoides]
MTKIWNESGFLADDPWIIETEEVQAGSNEKAILGLDAFLAKTDETGLGVLINPADDVRRLEGHLDRLALVAVAFPAFNDGRAFSHASLLRARLGFAGEVRAVGDVLIDQIPLMLRCGVDSFAVSNATALKRLAENRLPGIDNHYQPTARPSQDVGSYSWRRRA